MTYQFQRSMAQFERASRSLAGGVATAFRSAQQPVPAQACWWPVLPAPLSAA